MAGVLITRNKADDYAGGVFGFGLLLFQSDDGVEFSENRAGFRGGALAALESSVSGVGTYNIYGHAIFRKNQCVSRTGLGGALFIHGAGTKVTIHGSAVFQENFAFSGAGIASAEYTILDISGMHFLENEANTNLFFPGRGGALHLSTQTTIISGCTFTRNTAIAGGAIFGEEVDLHLRDGIVARQNNVRTSGSFIWIRRSSTLRLEKNVLVSENTAFEGGTIVGWGCNLGVETLYCIRCS